MIIWIAWVDTITLQRDNIQQPDPTAKSGDLIVADGSRICSSNMPGIASPNSLPLRRGLLSVLTKANHTCTGLGEKEGPRLRECCRQRQADVASKSRKKSSPNHVEAIFAVHHV